DVCSSDLPADDEELLVRLDHARAHLGQFALRRLADRRGGPAELADGGFLGGGEAQGGGTSGYQDRQRQSRDQPEAIPSHSRSLPVRCPVLGAGPREEELGLREQYRAAIVPEFVGLVNALAYSFSRRRRRALPS